MDMRRSRKFQLLVGGILAAGLLVGGAAIASNMGVRMLFPLNHTGGLSANDFEVSIPFFTPLVVANDILQASPGTVQVARLNPASNTFTIWVPTPGNLINNFPLAKGEGYLLRVPAGVSTAITLVGANDPTHTYNFNIAGRDFLTSIPFNTTWAKAQDAFLATPNAAQIAKLDPGSNTFTIWVPQVGALLNNFDIVIGEAYRFRVSAAPSVVSPEHF